MERRISVGKFRPKYVDHLRRSRWSRIFRSEETETNLSIWIPTEISGISGIMESIPILDIYSPLVLNSLTSFAESTLSSCADFITLHWIPVWSLDIKYHGQKKRPRKVSIKVENDHRSKFSNLSNWKEEAWKKSRLQRDSNPWPPRIPVRCSTNWAMKPHIGSEQLLKLENLLRWSFSTLIYNRSSNIWVISYRLHIKGQYLSKHLINITWDKAEKITFLLGSNGRNCAVPLCNSYGDIFDNSRKRNVTYHKMPSAPELKKLWLQRIRREEKSGFKVYSQLSLTRTPSGPAPAVLLREVSGL